MQQEQMERPQQGFLPHKQCLELFNTNRSLFMMGAFKVYACPFTHDHDHFTCFYIHDDDKKQRRQPWKCHGEYCKYGSRCKYGDSCTKPHNNLELRYHPENYKTQMCTAGESCAMGVLCAFAHQPAELRNPCTCEELLASVSPQEKEIYTSSFRVPVKAQHARSFGQVFSPRGPYRSVHSPRTPTLYHPAQPLSPASPAAARAPMSPAVRGPMSPAFRTPMSPAVRSPMSPAARACMNPGSPAAVKGPTSPPAAAARNQMSPVAAAGVFGSPFPSPSSIAMGPSPAVPINTARTPMSPPAFAGALQNPQSPYTAAMSSHMAYAAPPVAADATVTVMGVTPAFGLACLDNGTQQVPGVQGFVEQGSSSTNPMPSPEGLQRQGSNSNVLTWTKMCLPVIHFGILPDQQPKWGSVG